MADPNGQNTTPVYVKTVFTFSEAIEHIKLRNEQTTCAPPIHWVNAKTGKPVYIGYSS